MAVTQLHLENCLSLAKLIQKNLCRRHCHFETDHFLMPGFFKTFWAPALLEDGFFIARVDDLAELLVDGFFIAFGRAFSSSSESDRSSLSSAKLFITSRKQDLVEPMVQKIFPCPFFLRNKPKCFGKFFILRNQS